MALTAYSVENQITQILTELDCAVSNYAAIANKLSPSRVAAALSGTNNFSASDGEHHLRVAKSMKNLAADNPVPIDWKKIERIREVLQARIEPPSRPTPFTVILVGYELFKKISGSKIETTTSYQECAAFADFSVATAAAKLLAGMTESGLRTTRITNERRPAESVAETLQEVGFVQEKQNETVNE